VSGLRARLRLARKGFALDVDEQMPARGLTALFGASGSGKTTLLRCIAGLERAAEGVVSFENECWQDEARAVFLPPHRRACGYVFQEASLFPHLSVRGNLEYGEKRVPRPERRIALRQTAELLGIAPLLERRTTDLSGGERQRVAIARALLASPRLLLMDEPLASLDADRKGEILYYIERLRDELSLPIVYVSHAIDEVVRLADHVLVLEAGRVTTAGSVFDTVGRDHDGAVLQATVAEQDLEWGLARLEFAGGHLFSSGTDALVGERVRVRIAARDIGLALARPADSSFLNVLACTVTGIGGSEPASADVRLDAGGASLVARVTRKSVSILGLAPGKRVYALVKAVAVDRRSVGYS